jgi:molecular chaperone GrpE
MIDEKKQLEDVRESMTEASGVSQNTKNEITPTEGESVDTNLHSDADADSSLSMADQVVAEQGTPTGTENLVEQGGEEAPQLGEIEYQARLDELTREVEALKAQLEDRTSQYMRIAADFDNFRKRTQKEKEDLEQQIRCNTVSELLPVVDNFERARSQIKPQTDPEMNIHKSYQGVYKDFVERLKRIGVSPMRAEGKPFDPNLHEAVMRESTDEHPEGTVIEELVRGYLLGDRILRHAMVKVAAAPDPVIISEGDHQGNEEK